MRNLKHSKSPLLLLGTVLVIGGFVLATVDIAQATACTPGYWKNHTSAWCATYAGNPTLGSVFTGVPAQLSGDTLLDALNYGGGSTLVDAKRILLRAGVASLLNACAFDLFGFNDAGVKEQVNTGLACTDRDCVIFYAEYLDGVNNAASCPLT